MKTPNILKKAFNKAKDFINITKKEVKKVKRDFVKDFKRKYTSTKTVDKFEAGSLVTFTYNALDKTKKFDKKPLILSLGFSKKFGRQRFLGLNLHHLPESQRVLLASLVVEMLKKKKKLTYNDVLPLIKKFKGSPILRMYAMRRVSKKVIKMPQDIYLRAASIDYATWHNP